MSWILVNIYNNDRVFLNQEIFSIGRDNSLNLVCKSTVVSRNHAKILSLMTGTLMIVDQASVNGTFLNGQKLKEHKETQLHEDDEIGFGLCRNEQGVIMQENMPAPYYIYKVKYMPETVEILDSDEEAAVKNEIKIEETRIEMQGSVFEAELPDVDMISTPEQPTFESIQDRKPDVVKVIGDMIIKPTTIYSHTSELGSPEVKQVNGSSLINSKIYNTDMDVEDFGEEPNKNTKNSIKDELDEVSLMREIFESDETNKTTKIELPSAKSSIKSDKDRNTTRIKKTSNEKSNGVKRSKGLRLKNNKIFDSDTEEEDLDIKENKIVKKSDKDEEKKGRGSKKRKNSESSEIHLRKAMKAESPPPKPSNKIDLGETDLRIHLPKPSRSTGTRSVHNKTTDEKVELSKKKKPIEKKSRTKTASPQPSTSGLSSERHKKKDVKSHSSCRKKEHISRSKTSSPQHSDSKHSSFKIPSKRKPDIGDTRPPSPQINEYSLSDQIITIDDDGEEDQALICSQLFIKQEIDEVYLGIKKEVQEMDRYDEEVLYPPIDIDDIGDHHYTESELLRELADNDENDVANNDDADNDDAANDDADNDDAENDDADNDDADNNDMETEMSDKPDLNRATPLEPNESLLNMVTSKLSKNLLKKAIMIDAMPLHQTHKEKIIKTAEKFTTPKKVSFPKPAKKEDPRKKKEVVKKTPAPPLEFSYASPISSQVLLENKVVIKRPRPKESGKKMSHHSTASYNDNSRRMWDECGDVIFWMLMWNQDWFKQFDKCRRPPPVTKEPIIKMCNSFATYNDYYEVLKPLILLDYWYEIHKQYEHYSNARADAEITFSAVINEVRRTESYNELMCTMYLSKENHEKQNHIKDQTFIWLSVRFESEVKKHRMMFGVVTWIHKEKLRDSDQIDKSLASQCKPAPDTKLTFSVIVKSCLENVNTKFHLYARRFIQFNRFKLLVDSVKRLRYSPLLLHILEPMISDYASPKIEARPVPFNNLLNSSQKEAVLESVYTFDKEKGIYLIEGPPGTGKSTVIRSIVVELLNKPISHCILLLAPSNGAIDNMVEKLIDHNLKKHCKGSIKLVRIGNVACVKNSVERYFLDNMAKSNLRKWFFEKHPQCNRDYEHLKNEIEALKKKLKEQTVKDEAMSKQLDNKLSEFENFVKNYMNLREYIDQMEAQKLLLLQGANIICSTIGSVNYLNMAEFKRLKKIHICIIDEATQCSETETLNPMTMGINKFVLVGDPQQLPAVTSSQLLKSFDYGKSLFARIKTNLNRISDGCSPIKLLNMQYRMNPEISKFPNKHFYKGQIKDAPNFRVKRGLELLHPYLVFNQNTLNYKQYHNSHEVITVITLLKALQKLYTMEAELSIGIITPYTDQRTKFTHELKKHKFPENFKIVCNTVDGFQGQENDIIILSCVRSSSNSFFSDENRLNVALTRAKYGLYVIAMKGLFDTCSILKTLKHDAERRKLFRDLKCNLDSTAFMALLRKK